jgi:hypothetical protein
MMKRTRPIRIPANETPAQRQARLDREAAQNYRIARSTRGYYRDLDEITFSKPSTNKTK